MDEVVHIGDWLTWQLGAAVLTVTLVMWVAVGELFYRLDHRDKPRVNRDA